MEFHITGLRPVLDRSPNFEKFVPKDGLFVPKCRSFVPKFDFCEKTCNFHDYLYKNDLL